MTDPYEQPHQLQKYTGNGVTAPKNFALRVLVEGHGDVIGPLCRAAQIDPEVLLSELYLMTQKQPDLLKATPETLLPALAHGIKTGGRFGTDVHILTFNNRRAGKIEATACVDYKFLVKQIVAAGGARSIDPQLIYERDTFREVLGSERRLIHEPPKFGTDRGRVIGAYAIAHFGPNVPPRWVAMTVEQIETVRKGSKQWGPDKYPQAPDWYMLKCPLRRVGKLLCDNPKLAAMLHVLQQDAETDEGTDEIVVDGPLEMAPEPTAGVPESAFGNLPNPDHSPELARAMAYTVKGRTLAELANDELTKLEQWALDKDNQRVADMCGLVLHYRTTQAAQQALELEPVE